MSSSSYARFPHLPNVAVFTEQVGALKRLLATSAPSEEQSQDDLLLAVGELFTLVVYAHLILEAAPLWGTDDDTVDTIFDVLVRDLSRHALQLHLKPAATAAQAEGCRALLRRPATDPARVARVWSGKVYALRDTYRMRD